MERKTWLTILAVMIILAALQLPRGRDGHEKLCKICGREPVAFLIQDAEGELGEICEKCARLDWPDSEVDRVVGK